jgi:hypothetical protein
MFIRTLFKGEQRVAKQPRSTAAALIWGWGRLLWHLEFADWLSSFFVSLVDLLFLPVQFSILCVQLFPSLSLWATGVCSCHDSLSRSFPPHFPLTEQENRSWF